jgi:hypothetical protein
MKTTERICSHDIEFNYFSKSKNAIPNEAEVEHVQGCLVENCVSGELCMTKIIRGREYEFGGWWHIRGKDEI